MCPHRVRDLEALAPEWDTLWQRCPAATPFQHPGWLLPWWKIFGSGELFTFAVRDHARLIALAPMFLHTWNARRQVTFLGNGVSDRLDILAEPETADAACSLILDCLAEQRDLWDICDLQDLPPGSPLLNSEPPAPIDSATRPQYHCSSVPVPDAIDVFYEGLPHGLRRNLRRYRTHLESEGTLRFETAGQAQFDEYIHALFALHRARWHEKNDPGMLDGPGLERFHLAAARNLWEPGLVRLHALRLNECIRAVVYAFIHRQRAYSYIGGFDPALARFSPGALILEYTIQQAILEGVREFDFLRGREAYKSDWGAKPHSTSRLILWHDQQPLDLLHSGMA